MPLQPTIGRGSHLAERLYTSTTFLMITTRSVRVSVNVGDPSVSIDLEDASLHKLMHSSVAHFLHYAFEWRVYHLW